MAAEHEAFGFYFSAHPVDAHKHLLAAHKVRLFAQLGDVPVAEGERIGAMMAALVEDARWRTSARGRRYMMATLSDPSGQFVAAAFDDEVCAALEAGARAGTCALLNVELDRRAGDEAPRVTVKRVQPLETLAKTTRLEMIIAVADSAAATQLASELRDARGGNGTVHIRVAQASGGEATVLLGRDFALDGELASRIERIVGEGNVELAAQEPPKLALVG
jgi:DNA polymerase-3 subunit alpha